MNYLNLCLQMRINNSCKWNICYIESNYGVGVLDGTFGTEFLNKSKSSYVVKSLFCFMR